MSANGRQDLIRRLKVNVLLIRVPFSVAKEAIMALHLKTRKRHA
jgi:hypothetical protein